MGTTGPNSSGRMILWFMILLMAGGCATTPPPVTAPLQAAAASEAAVSVKALLSCRIEDAGGKERLVLVFERAPSNRLSRTGESSIQLTLDDATAAGVTPPAPGGRAGGNIAAVRFQEEKSGSPAKLLVAVDLKTMTPYRLTHTEKEIVLEFSRPSAARAVAAPAATSPVAPVTASPAGTSSVAAEIVDEMNKENALEYRGQKMSISVQNAAIASVFRMISEVSGKSVVSGPGVDQKITIHMKNVPWDQVLDTILELNALGKRESGDVITVLPLEDIKRAEEEQLKKDVSEGKRRQIAIEAKIVEASTLFTRELGVQWGYGFKDVWSGRDVGFMFGSGSLGLAGDTPGTVTTLPGSIGLTGSNIAVNFPTVTGADSLLPGIGIIAGTSRFILDAKLEALEVNGDGRIISSPKVTTLDNVEATIKQGEEIPYAVTDKEGNRSISFKDAALLLTVKPTITREGRISMTIMAKNDYADWTKTNTSKENPPINTSSVDSTVIVNNGDTIVVGGVLKVNEDMIDQGIPWLSKIPILGWLFKAEKKTTAKRELLIFVTPRIVGE